MHFLHFTCFVLAIRKVHPKFAKEFDKSSVVLEPFGIELGKVSFLRSLKITTESFNEYFIVFYLLSIIALIFRLLENRTFF